MDMAVPLIQITVANNKKKLQDEGIADGWRNVEKQGGNDHPKLLNIQNPNGIFFHSTRIKTKDM